MSMDRKAEQGVYRGALATRRWRSVSVGRWPATIKAPQQRAVWWEEYVEVACLLEEAQQMRDPAVRMRTSALRGKGEAR